VVEGPPSADSAPPARPSLDGIPPPGSVIDGKYRVIESIGQGGMGVVLAAEAPDGRRVAVKLMIGKTSADPAAVRRFVMEARTIGTLGCEHIVEVLDTGWLEGGRPYMVLELLEGTDLSDAVRRDGKLPIPTAVDYLLQACEGVAQAHAHGIVHRDLKPSNLFLSKRDDGSDVVKVLDFGLSKALPAESATVGGDLTQSNAFLGSPHFMSPEQIRDSKTVDGRSDIWALGAILHRLVTGHLPFEGDNIGAYLARIMVDPPTALKLHEPEAPDELEQVVARCMQKDMMRRYQDVGQLAEALAPFAENHEAFDRAARIQGALAEADAAARLGPEGAPEMRRVAAEAIVDSALRHAITRVESSTTGWDEGSRRPPAEPKGRPRWYAVALLAVLVAIVGIGLQQLVASPTPPPTRMGQSADSAAASPSASPIAETEVSVVAATPKQVKLQLRIDPPDATVTVDGEPSDENPLLLDADSGQHVIEVSAPGYVALSKTVTASESDSELTLMLMPAEEAAAGSAVPRQPARAPGRTTQHKSPRSASSAKGKKRSATSLGPLEPSL
jgi:serine/threonine-protein kinase